MSCPVHPLRIRDSSDRCILYPVFCALPLSCWHNQYRWTSLSLCVSVSLFLLCDPPLSNAWPLHCPCSSSSRPFFSTQLILSFLLIRIWGRDRAALQAAQRQHQRADRHLGHWEDLSCLHQPSNRLEENPPCTHVLDAIPELRCYWILSLSYIQCRRHTCRCRCYHKYSQ